jgi:hypothetical protein
VGIVGLSGFNPLCSFNEDLPPHVVEAIATAFLEYVRVLFGRGFAEQIAEAEAAELERLYVLPDTRMN